MKENDGKELEMVVDMEKDWFIKKIYTNFLLRKPSPWKLEVSLKITRFVGKVPESAISYDDFERYY